VDCVIDVIISPTGFAGAKLTLKELDAEEPELLMAVAITKYALPAVRPVMTAVLFTRLVVIEGEIEGIKLYE